MMKARDSMKSNKERKLHSIKEIKIGLGESSTLQKINHDA